MFIASRTTVLLIVCSVLCVGCRAKIRESNAPYKISIREAATKRPFVRDEEILFYDWDRHTFLLNVSIADRIERDSENWKHRNLYELVVGNEILYHGYLGHLNDSMLPPNTSFHFERRGNQLLVYAGRPRNDNSVEGARKRMPDIRNNRRLWTALSDSERLKCNE